MIWFTLRLKFRRGGGEGRRRSGSIARKTSLIQNKAAPLVSSRVGPP